MSKIVDGLGKTNEILVGVNNLFTPTGAVTLLVEGIRAFIKARRERGEDVPVDLEEKLDNYDGAIDELEALIADYWSIPAKPMVSDPDATAAAADPAVGD